MLDINLWSFIIQSSFVVKLVMLILLCASILSWTLIIQRFFLIKRHRLETNAFEQSFWSGGDLNQLFAKLKKQPGKITSLAAIFYAGFKEYLNSSKNPELHNETRINTIQRAMHITKTQELSDLEKHLPWLATIGSNSVYIGLFGTVWGIMSSFQALGAVQQANIAMVAPGISEALIATAMGLIAAIPAVIAYNLFTHQLDQLEQRYELFQEEFAHILHHQMPTHTKEPT